MESLPFSATRILVTSEWPYEVVRQTLESSVGKIHPAIFEHLMATSRSFDHLRRTLREFVGGYELVVFAEIDQGKMLSLAGFPLRAKQYIVGDPWVAYPMYAENPVLGLYSPFRLFLYETPAGQAVLAYDLPSSLLNALSSRPISSAAHSLDEKLERLVTRAAQGGERVAAVG